MAIKKGKPANPKDIPNQSGRQPVPEKTPDKRVTKKYNTEQVLRREFRNSRRGQALK